MFIGVATSTIVATSVVATAIVASLTISGFLVTIAVGVLGIVFFGDSFMTFRYDVTLEATMVAVSARMMTVSSIGLYDVGV
jgi:hypothetical protein